MCHLCFSKFIFRIWRQAHKLFINDLIACKINQTLTQFCSRSFSDSNFDKHVLLQNYKVHKQRMNDAGAPGPFRIIYGVSYSRTIKILNANVVDSSFLGRCGHKRD